MTRNFFDISIGTLAWRVVGGLVLFAICALCARAAEPMPYIPWLPPPPTPCDGKVFVTEMPQFDPNMVTPPGLNAAYTPTTYNNTNLRSPSASSGSSAGTGMDNTVLERDRLGEVVGTPVVSSGVLSSPAGAVQNQWLDDKQLTHQWAPPKVDAMFLSAGQNCVDPSFCPHAPPTYPAFGVEVDGILLHRNRANFSALNASLGIVPTSGEQVDLGGGGRVRFVFLGIDHHDFEVLYFGTDAWDAAETYNDLQGILQTALFTSQIFNWEVNFRQRSCDYEWLTWLYGVRYIEFSEDVQVPFQIPGVGQSMLNIGADNYLYGAQLGVELLLWQPSERWKFEAYSKFGAYINNASNSAIYTVNGVNLFTSTRNHYDPAAFVGDLGLNATWNIHRQCGIHAGYQYTVIDNVAMTPDALYDDSRTHTLTVHGGYVGCEIRW